MLGLSEDPAFMASFCDEFFMLLNRGEFGYVLVCKKVKKTRNLVTKRNFLSEFFELVGSVNFKRIYLCVLYTI
jgi:hypothetical protein